MNSISLLWSLKNVYGLFFRALLVYLVFWYVWYPFKNLANFRHWIRIFAQDQGSQNMRYNSIIHWNYRKYQFFTVKSLYLIRLSTLLGIGEYILKLSDKTVFVSGWQSDYFSETSLCCTLDCDLGFNPFRFYSKFV